MLIPNEFAYLLAFLCVFYKSYLYVLPAIFLCLLFKRYHVCISNFEMVDYTKFKVPELKAKCKELGLLVGGTKKVLIRRLQDFYNKILQAAGASKASTYLKGYCYLISGQCIKCRICCTKKYTLMHRFLFLVASESPVQNTGKDPSLLPYWCSLVKEWSHR